VITLSAIIRFLHLASSALFFGALVFRMLVAGPALRKAGADNFREIGAYDRSLMGFLQWTLLAIFTTGLFAFWLQIASVAGVSLALALSPENMGGVLFGTRYGVVWLARMVLIALLAGVLIGRHPRQSFFARVATVCLAAALAGSVALSGHAAAGDGIWLGFQLAADGLHLLAAHTWLGGLVAFAWFLLWIKRMSSPWSEIGFKEATRRFSLLGLLSVLILVLTGTCNAWNLVGAVPPLVGTTYGQLLLIKIALTLPLLGVAAMNLRSLKPQIAALPIAGATDSFKDLLARLKRNVTAEIALGACVLFIVGGLSVTPPALHIQPDWPFAFRWNWNAADSSRKVRAKMADAERLTIAGILAIGYAVLRRRPRYRVLAAGVVSLAYGGWVTHTALFIDAYPTTYLRPTVPYNAISVANGARLYQDACAVCHGVAGYGDGEGGKGLKPRPADLTAKHSADHTAGDLFWWLSHGMKNSAMPGYAASLDEEERWDMINFLRALSSAERARQMSALVEPDPWLVAPNFVYRTLTEESRALKDYRGNHIVLLVLFSLPDSHARLLQLAQVHREAQSRNVKILAIPRVVKSARRLESMSKTLSVVTDGSHEAFASYALFRRSFSEQGALPDPPVPRHMEFLVDRQGYARARWIPRDGPGWDKLDNLWRDIDQLNREKPSTPAPDDHVH